MAKLLQLIKRNIAYYIGGNTLTKNFGHEIYYLRIFGIGGWYYWDTDEKLNIGSRSCPKCECYPSKDGHDPCIANLPGVKHACCGHGDMFYQYVMLNDNTVIRSLEEYFKRYPKQECSALK